MDVHINKRNQPGPMVPADILGQNIEMCLTTADGVFLANRDIARTVRVSLDGCVAAGADYDALTAASTLGGFTPCRKRLDGATLVLPPLSIIRIRQPRR